MGKLPVYLSRDSSVLGKAKCGPGPREDLITSGHLDIRYLEGTLTSSRGKGREFQPA